VQEVENIDILRKFNKDYLGSKYNYQILIEVMILDLLMSPPVNIAHRGCHFISNCCASIDPTQPIFGRDLLEVEIWNEKRTTKLFTLYNTHLKSHFVSLDEDPVMGAAEANQRRIQQAEVMPILLKNECALTAGTL